MLSERRSSLLLRSPSFLVPPNFHFHTLVFQILPQILSNLDRKQAFLTLLSALG